MRAGQRAPRWLPKVSRVSGPSLALRDGDGNLRCFCGDAFALYTWWHAFARKRPRPHAPSAAPDNIGRSSHVIYSPPAVDYWFAGHSRVSEHLFNNYEFRKSRRKLMLVLPCEALKYIFLSLSIPGAAAAAADQNFCKRERTTLCVFVWWETPRFPLGVCLSM